MLYDPVKIFSVMSGRFPELNQWLTTKQWLECIAQGHNSTVTPPALSLELTTLRSLV